ncbi:TPA: hypothetical protein EYP44_05985 [Candidatus Bathyarchaeota archaeon]|nr:hypothetical protein [Candidatus Bathyarchaeota archaeon]
MGVIPSVEHKESVRKGHRVGPTGQVIRGGSESFVVLIRDTGSLRRLGGVVADFSRDLAKRIASERGKTPSILALPAGLLAPLRGALRRGCKPVYKKELERFLQHGIYGLKRVSYRFLERLFGDMLEGVDDDRLRFVENLVRSKISLLPVKEIRKVEPSSRFVYDIEVLGLHTFVGGLGPILLHNTDGDPWGLHIAMVIISGSAEAAHIRELATPSAKWAGVWATDIVKYDLPTDPLTPIDIKRLYELRKDPRYRGKLWEREISTFLRIKRKAEQEAFCRYGLTYVVDTYLPEKIKLVV